MQLKRVISSLLLAIYLMASCGSMLTVILCHCSRSQHIATQHCCHHCSHCEDGDGIKLPTDCCNHDHSNQIDLYNHEKSIIKSFAPVVCSILPQIEEQIEGSVITTNPIHLDRRKTPLPIADFVALKGLRAPPVIA